MLLPIGHDQGEVWRWPVVTLVLIAVNILVWVDQRGTVQRESRVAYEAYEAVIDHLVEHPWLEASDELGFSDDTRRQLAEIREEARRQGMLDRVATRYDQQTLDELTTSWLETVENNTFRRFGYVAAEPSAFGLFTSLFVHAGFWHLFGNLLFLYLLGPPIEDVWGRPLFALLYLASGVASALLHGALTADPMVPLVGASGAISGLMGVFLLRFARARLRFLWLLWPIFFKTFEAPAWIVLLFYLARESLFAMTFSVNADLSSGTAHLAHVGGFLLGAVVAVVVGKSGLEERYLRRAIGAKVELTEKPALEQAHELRAHGRFDEALRLLADTHAQDPTDQDVLQAWWDVAVQSSNESRVMPSIARAVRWQLARGDREAAVDMLSEIARSSSELGLRDAELVSLAEAAKEARALTSAEMLADRAVRSKPAAPALQARLARLLVRSSPQQATLLARSSLASGELPGVLEAEMKRLIQQLTI